MTTKYPQPPQYITFIPCLVEDHANCDAKYKEDGKVWVCRCDCHSKK